MSNVSIKDPVGLGYLGFGLISLISLLVAVAFEAYLVALVPLAVLFGIVAIIDFKKIFYLLLFFIPLSIEFSVTNSLATDLPTEPLIVALMFIYFLFVLTKPSYIDARFIQHPIIVLLVIHVFWTFITALNSEEALVSFKFLLAKLWYVVVFVFLTALIVKDAKTFKPAFWAVFVPLLAVTLATLVRQTPGGFAFEDVNEHVVPYFRNHVNYAATISLFFPFIVLALGWYKRSGFTRWLLIFGIVVFLLGIYFSYTRACWLALILAAFAYLIIKMGWLRYLLMLSFAILIGLVIYLANQNTFLKYAPQFERTLTYKDFDEHLIATVNMEDASSMERFYRWVAAAYMIQHKPLVGYGPGNFYPYYKKFTVSEFRTYISDNEERSTVHNYFLLVLVEQGFPGLVIFVGLTFALFYAGERIYLRITDKGDKRFAMAALLSLVVIYTNLMLSDLVEVDKTGSFFFMNIAFLVNLGMKYPKQATTTSIKAAA